MKNLLILSTILFFFFSSFSQTPQTTLGPVFEVSDSENSFHLSSDGTLYEVDYNYVWNAKDGPSEFIVKEFNDRLGEVSSKKYSLPNDWEGDIQHRVQAHINGGLYFFMPCFLEKERLVKIYANRFDYATKKLTSMGAIMEIPVAKNRKNTQAMLGIDSSPDESKLLISLYVYESLYGKKSSEPLPPKAHIFSLNLSDLSVRWNRSFEMPEMVTVFGKNYPLEDQFMINNDGTVAMIDYFFENIQVDFFSDEGEPVSSFRAPEDYQPLTKADKKNKESKTANMYNAVKLKWDENGHLFVAGDIKEYTGWWKDPAIKGFFSYRIHPETARQYDVVNQEIDLNDFYPAEKKDVNKAFEFTDVICPSNGGSYFIFEHITYEDLSESEAALRSSHYPNPEKKGANSFVFTARHRFYYDIIVYKVNSLGSLDWKKRVRRAWFSQGGLDINTAFRAYPGGIYIVFNEEEKNLPYIEDAIVDGKDVYDLGHNTSGSKKIVSMVTVASDGEARKVKLLKPGKGSVGHQNYFNKLISLNANNTDCILLHRFGKKRQWARIKM